MPFDTFCAMQLARFQCALDAFEQRILRRLFALEAERQYRIDRAWAQLVARAAYDLANPLPEDAVRSRRRSA